MNDIHSSSVIRLLCPPQMENFGVCSFSEGYLLVGPETDYIRRRRIFRLICHEVSHQWFVDCGSLAAFLVRLLGAPLSHDASMTSGMSLCPLFFLHRYGNTVTCSSWKELWLQEVSSPPISLLFSPFLAENNARLSLQGVARFLEHCAVHSIDPSFDIWRQFLQTVSMQALISDTSASTHAVVCDFFSFGTSHSILIFGF